MQGDPAAGTCAAVQAALFAALGRAVGDVVGAAFLLGQHPVCSTNMVSCLPTSCMVSRLGCTQRHQRPMLHNTHPLCHSACHDWCKPVTSLLLLSLPGPMKCVVPPVPPGAAYTNVACRAGQLVPHTTLCGVACPVGYPSTVVLVNGQCNLGTWAPEPAGNCGEQGLWSMGESLTWQSCITGLLMVQGHFAISTTP